MPVRAGNFLEGALKHEKALTSLPRARVRANFAACLIDQYQV
jgi:hypothetical protein